MSLRASRSTAGSRSDCSNRIPDATSQWQPIEKRRLGGAAGRYTLALMKWASFVSEEPFLEAALRQAAAEIVRQLEGAPADLLLVFVSPHHEKDYPELSGTLRLFFPTATIIGCTGGGVVGGGREIEHATAISVTAAALPGVRLRPFYLDQDQTELLEQEPSLWPELLDLGGEEPVHFVLLPDPHSCDARALLSSLDNAFPRSVKTGGLASGAVQPNDNALFLNESVYAEGAVGLAMAGALDVDTIVAQGCRPIGAPLFVTRVFRNRILELDGRRPTDLLSEVFAELPAPDRAVFRHSVCIGVVMKQGLSEYGHGDFLIRNLMGIDTETGVIMVGETLERGQVVQFHLRDAASSARDLEQLLKEYKQLGGPDPEGALLFSCLGRGATLYGEAHHDSRMIAHHLGPVPIGGFFCSGEIGPVHRKTFLHGFTSSIALFRSPRIAGGD